MSAPAPSTRRCPYCDAANPLEAASCVTCKHSLPLAESEEETGFLTAPGRPSFDEQEAPTGYRTAPGRTEVDDGEAPTDYSPHPGRGAASGSRHEDGPLETGQKFGRYHIIKLLGLGGMGAHICKYGSCLSSIDIEVVKNR